MKNAPGLTARGVFHVSCAGSSAGSKRIQRANDRQVRLLCQIDDPIGWRVVAVDLRRHGPRGLVGVVRRTIASVPLLSST